MAKNIINRPFLIAALVVSLLGVVFSLYLTYHHWQIIQQGAAAEAVCDINQTFNCTHALASHYSRLGPFTVSAIAVGFYLYFCLSLFSALKNAARARDVLIPPFMLSLFNLGVTIFMAYVSLGILETFCPFCVVLYGISLLLFITLKIGINMSFKDLFKNLFNSSWLKSYTTFLLVIGLVTGGNYLIEKNLLRASSQEKSSVVQKDSKEGNKDHKKLSQKEKAKFYVTALLNQPAKEISLEGRPIKGNPNAKITVVEFSDFECPYCKRAANELKKILKKYGDQVTMVFFQYPLDQACHPLLTRPGHKKACAAAYASYCAAKQQKFWEYHDALFDRQPKYSEKDLQKVAKDLELDLEKFNSCRQDSDTQRAILKDLQAGIDLKIGGTPTVFVNGRKLGPWYSEEVWEELVKQIK